MHGSSSMSMTTEPIGGGTSFQHFFIETWDFVCMVAPYSSSSSSDTALHFPFDGTAPNGH